MHRDDGLGWLTAMARSTPPAGCDVVQYYEDRKNKIVERRAAGMRVTAIADEFGIGRERVYEILRQCGLGRGY